ncbi:malate dehydrogenase (quinone) [Lentibacillus amyloliquefaciens]|uniref:Probable malate:quinone oxidoreductase n=1 Tax=Lentibacillus amyloliquefaciens TaxID=1472767 RepID=A0A0U4FMQ1_9BACI|nr:malate dehydrogenase (quinone) [Lentibacillus amyloliquefaciens]ALX49012.1 malate:quinone oxidoreductase [Lentibacillus amyloliquefaciens]
MSYESSKSDVVLIGAGIMSTTLGVLIKELAPDWKITVFEQLGVAGGESSNEKNNSGTGHAALCELNYTAEQADGTIDISQAVRINERFQLSRQLWAYLADRNLIENPRNFITGLPHMSFVKGKENVAFLKKRVEALSNHPLFQEMAFSDDPNQLKEWFPLIMNNRPANEPVAGTKIDDGTDVNFGELTRTMSDYLEREDVNINYNHSVQDIKQTTDGTWELKVRDKNGAIGTHKSRFVFIGAGGGSLSLLQKTGTPEGKHIGGFPISGQYLECNNPEVIEQHYAKVYGKNPPGAPLMVVPHLDTRFIDGKRALIFGPFAGFSPKFLKTGSNKDLFASVKPHNMITMLAAGLKNISLLQYLIQQLRLTKKERMNELREFFPDAKDEDWELKIAGQRVQVIKDTSASKGTIQFSDTEVVHSHDRSLAALLGGSPGASTSVSDMIGLIETCFPQKMDEWKPKLKEMIPSYGENLSDKPELIAEIKSSTIRALELDRNM